MPVSRDALMQRLAGLPGAALGEGAFAPGPAIWAGRREIAHVDRGGALDIRLTRAVIRDLRPELRANPRVTLRASASDWIAFDLGDAADHVSGDVTAEAVHLVGAALAANLPAAEPGPPPTGADLERRRRFH